LSNVEKNYVTLKIIRIIYPNEQKIKIPDKRNARNAASILYFSLIKGTFDVTIQRIQQKVMTDILFIVSHAKTFGPRIRTHVWKYFNQIVTLKSKQMALFERWITPNSLKYAIDRENHDDEDDDGSKTDESE
jgi:hypothetical protein